MSELHARGGRQVDRAPGAVAIVGMAGIFPGAPDVHRYWQNILARLDATGDPPPEWEAELYLDPDARTDDHPYCVRGGYLGPLAEFSPSDLGVMPSSVDGTEPDHFLALRAAYEALVDAGYASGGVDRTRTEVIVGRGTYVNRGNTTVVQHAVMLDQLLRILKQLHPEHTDEEIADIRRQLKASLPPFHAETAAGLVPNIITGRIANRLDCMGANYIVDAACASSLVAVDLAMRDLLSGRCDLAVAGGVHASTPSPIVTIFCQLKAISPKGQIRPFDSGADGTLLGEGVGMVALKRLADAERDGDRIYAVIRGVGVASDGRAVGLLAPRREGEELALRRAYETAGVPPETIGLVEAHGTATTVGDTVEVEALSRVFGPRRSVHPRVALGSVKSMIGHLMPASGAAGLIKAALALHHRVLPPTIHCESPNPKLGLDRSVFYLNTEPRPWIHGGGEPRRAGVNAFGFGGINAHAILEEYVGDGRAPASSLREWDSEVFVLSADSREALAAEADRLRETLGAAGGATLKDLAYTLNVTRPFGPSRLALVAGSVDELRAKLERAAARLRDGRVRRIRELEGIYYVQRPLAAEGTLAFVFPGEGSQYQNMLADLCMHFPEVRAVFDLMDRAFVGHPRGYLPSDIIFPRGSAQAPADGNGDGLYGMDAGAEAVFTANQAMAALMRALGVRARAVVGHSTGEHSALIVSGVVRTEDDDELIRHVLGVNGVYEQLHASSGVPEGMLLATGGVEVGVLREIVAATQGAVHIAMDNCPHQVVLCGSSEAIGAISRTLTEARAICQALPFARAYHTPWFEIFCRPLRAYFDGVTIEPPSAVDVYSCVTAERYPGDAAAIRELVSIQWARPVRFRETVEAMHRDGVRLFVEVGPRSNLTGFIDDTLRGREYVAIASNVPHRSGLAQLNHLVGQLVAHGVDLRLARLYEHRAPRAIAPGTPADASRRRPALRLKTGLQPMRLPADFVRPRRTEVVPPAAATVVASAAMAPAAASSPARPSPVLGEHFKTMARFLEVQTQVMGAFLRGRSGHAHRSPHARAPLPFIDSIVSHDPGRSVMALVRLDPEQHPFFGDHTLGREVSAADPTLIGLPVLPLTFSIEILAEAAATLMPGRTLTRIEQVRAYRWIVVEDATTLVVSARVTDAGAGAVHVDARAEGGVAGPPLIEAVAILEPQLPGAPPPAAFSPRDARPSSWTPERLYRDGMFHGPAFRAVRTVDAYGEDGNVSTLVAPDRRGLFRDREDPGFLTDAVLLDAAGQALAFWAKERLGAHVDVFPFRVAAIRVFQPPPHPGTPVRCHVRAALVGERQTTCDIDLIDPAGRLVYRVEGWEDRRFELPPALLQLRISPRDAELARPWDAAIAGVEQADDIACCRLAELSEDLLEGNQGIWLKMLAHLVLSRRERAAWANVTGIVKRRHEWLLGRAVAKDAVRRLLKARFGLAIAPADVEILPDVHGRPEVHGAWRSRLGVAPAVSIAHSGGVAVALAALDGRRLVGIDIERISRREDGFERLAFTSDERRLLESLGDEAVRREWHLRLWCAKEAAGKALGRGFAAGLHSLQVTEARAGDGAVRLQLSDALGAEFPAVRRRGMTAFTTREGDFVSSAIVSA